MMKIHESLLSVYLTSSFVRNNFLLRRIVISKAEFYLAQLAI